MNELYENVIKARKNLIAFIKDKNNDLDDRFTLFVKSINLLPIGRSVSAWSFTNRDSATYNILDNPFENFTRGICRADFVIEMLYDMFDEVPDEVAALYPKYDIPLSVHLKHTNEEDRANAIIVIEALLGECLAGTSYDW